MVYFSFILAGIAGPASTPVSGPGQSDPVTGLIGAAAFLAFSGVFAILAWKEPVRSSRAVHFATGAAALLLALWSALGGLGLAAPALQLAGYLVGLAAGVGSLALLPRWLATPSLPESQRLRAEKDRALARLRESEARLLAQARDLEDQVAVRTAELKESEARLQGFVQHAPAGIAFKNLAGDLLLVNRRAEQMFGGSLVMRPGRNLQECVPADLAAQVREQDQRVLSRLEEIQEESSITFPDHTVHDLLITRFPLIDLVGHCWGVGVIATDITERKQVEQAQGERRSQEALTFLAGGIAHDFNNLLGAMLGNLESAQQALEPGHPAGPELRTIGELINRAAALVSQILAYAGRGRSQVRAIDLNREVEALTRILRASLGYQATLDWQPAAGLPPMEGDLGQVQTVVMNLVRNAAEAVDSRQGVITLRTGLETLDQAAIDRHYPCQPLAPGAFLVLEVADNGHGMPPAVRERIFEPFYTTRFTGRGLGLSAVQGILRGHRGGIRVVSEEGRGTTFRLVFPAAATLPAPAPPPREPAEPLAAGVGSGAILLVDDEPVLRQTVAKALRRMGFEPLEAGDGVEALEVYAANRERIVLVLMDLTMPRMDGEEAYRRLRWAGARVPIILSSGFCQEEALRRFRSKGLAGFLPKPYPFQTLATLIREVLAGRYDRPSGPARQLPWWPELLTGHEVIDRQHQDLVRAFNQVVAATAAGDLHEAPAAALAGLEELALRHFEAEEELMAVTGYPDLAAHREVHAHLVGQLSDLAGGLRRREVAMTAPVFDFLEDWLFFHMQMEDVDLARHLQK